MTIASFIEHADTAADIAGVVSLELEGHWPWQRSRERGESTASTPDSGAPRRDTDL